MTKPGPSVTSGADTQPGSDSLFPSGFGGGANVRAGGVGTTEIADGSVAAADLNLSSVAAAIAARSELTGTYASALRSRLGGRWVALGDSITAGIGGAYYEDAAQILSYGKLRLVRNAGFAGDTSAQMLARFDTDVTPYAPNIVTILAGTNDTGTSVPLATYQANIQAIVAKCKTIGAVPVLVSIPPNGTGSPTSRKQDIITFNNWLRIYALANALPFIDVYGLLVDPATGAYLSAYDQGDHTHPSPAGMQVIGNAIQSGLSSLLPPFGTPMPQDDIDANNLVKNALFLSNSGTKGNFWSAFGAGQTFSIDTTDTTIKGNWQRIQTTSGNTGIQATILGSGPVAGRTYALCGRVKVAAGAAQVQLQRNFSTKVIAPVDSIAYTISGGAFYGEWVATSGTTSLSVLVLGQAAVTDFSVAQVGLYDLTAMGLA